MPRPNHLAAAPKQQIVISIERAVSTAPAGPALRRPSSTSNTHLMKLRSSGHRTAPRARPYFPLLPPTCLDALTPKHSDKSERLG